MQIADIQLNPCEFHSSTTIVMGQFNCISQIQCLVFNLVHSEVACMIYRYSYMWTFHGLLHSTMAMVPMEHAVSYCTVGPIEGNCVHMLS